MYPYWIMAWKEGTKNSAFCTFYVILNLHNSCVIQQNRSGIALCPTYRTVCRIDVCSINLLLSKCTSCSEENNEYRYMGKKIPVQSPCIFLSVLFVCINEVVCYLSQWLANFPTHNKYASTLILPKGLKNASKLI